MSRIIPGHCSFNTSGALGMECGDVTIVYMGYLAETMGGRERRARVCGEARVRDLVGIPEEELEDLVVLVNGRSAKPDSPVRPGDKITVLPHISGG